MIAVVQDAVIYDVVVDENVWIFLVRRRNFLSSWTMKWSHLPWTWTWKKHPDADLHVADSYVADCCVVAEKNVVVAETDAETQSVGFGAVVVAVVAAGDDDEDDGDGDDEAI